ncbi:hypothetical protein GCM10011512_25160 [Tersicoccus solisilvae]|uniref:Uncharacterized protein n=1 Tax=Tersicoccus solisilvae TaxID=1882339 RepID=A0ABQ1PH97_9MICC|nr:hypothetical protein [Tersicoccus solisilvae]GGC97119.1 hypothetical protein GCM10011512_25160 [Tersicoccus solisilvae]
MSDASGEQEKFIAVARQLHALIPPAFEKIDMRVSATHAVQTSVITAEDQQGNRQSLQGSDEVDDAVDDLRAAMYRPGSGTWFSAVLTVTAAGKADASYNYDDEPTWPFPVDPQVYATDLEAFPRDDAHLPEWLRQKVRDHAAGRTE